MANLNAFLGSATPAKPQSGKQGLFDFLSSQPKWKSGQEHNTTNSGYVKPAAADIINKSTNWGEAAQQLRDAGYNPSDFDAQLKNKYQVGTSGTNYDLKTAIMKVAGSTGEPTTQTINQPAPQPIASLTPQQAASQSPVFKANDTSYNPNNIGLHGATGKQVGLGEALGQIVSPVTSPIINQGKKIVNTLTPASLDLSSAIFHTPNISRQQQETVENKGYLGAKLTEGNGNVASNTAGFASAVGKTGAELAPYAVGGGEGSLLEKGVTNAAIGALNEGGNVASGQKFSWKDLASNVALGVGQGLIPELPGALSKVINLGKAPNLIRDLTGAGDAKAVNDVLAKYEVPTPKNDPFFVKDLAASKKTTDTKAQLLDAANKDRVYTQTLSEKDITPTEPVKTPEYDKKVQDTLNKTAVVSGKGSNARQAIDELKTAFDVAPGKENAQTKLDLRGTMGDIASNNAREALTNEGTTKFFNKMKPGDNLNFIQRAESGIKEATPELQAQQDKFRQFYKEDLSTAQDLKPDLLPIPNYMARAGFWDATKADVDAAYAKFAKPGLAGNPSALETRKFPTIYDGIAAGLRPKETNPMTIALTNRAQLIRYKAAQDFLEKHTDDPAAKTLVDNWLDNGLKGSAWYRTSRDAANAVNNIQLGLSLFHGTGTAINATLSRGANAIEAATSGHPVAALKNLATSPIAPVLDEVGGHNVIKAAIDDDIAGKYGKYVKAAKDVNFSLIPDKSYQTNGITKSVDQVLHGTGVDKVKGALTAAPRLVSSLSKPLMQHWVPNLKAGAFKAGVDLIDTKGLTEAERTAAVAKLADSIDNRMGQMNLDNTFMRAKVADALKVGTRSPSWNLGTFREIGGGLSDVAVPNLGEAVKAAKAGGSTKDVLGAVIPDSIKSLIKGQGVSQRTAYTASIAAGVALMGGALQYAYTGQWPTSVKDYYYPRTGLKTKAGDDERVSLPTYAKDIVSFMTNPLTTAANKLSPLLTEGGDIIQNKDYFGNEIRNPNDSAVTQAGQIAKYLVGENLPFSVQSSDKRVNPSISTTVQSLLGINVAPGYITKTPFSNDLQQTYYRLNGSSLTPEEAAQKQARPDQPEKDTINQYYWNQIFSQDKPEALRLLMKATPQDMQDLGISPDAIKQSAAYTISSPNSKADATSKEAAQQIIDTLNGKDAPIFSNALEYKTYPNEKSVVNTIAAYLKAAVTSPGGTAHDILSGQRILRTTNGAIIVERLPLSDSEAIKKQGGGDNTEMKLDHTVPLQIGGTNDASNLKLVPTATWQSYTPVEDLLGKLLDDNKINAQQAKSAILDYKQGRVSSDDIYRRFNVTPPGQSSQTDDLLKQRKAAVAAKAKATRAAKKQNK